MKKHLIIGGSTAGLAAARTIRKHDKKSRIVMVSQEKHLPYSKVLLTHFIAGHVGREQLNLADASYFKQSRTDFIPGVKVVAVNAERKKVVLENDQILDYDTLLVATGGIPAQPPAFAWKQPGSVVLRNIEDAQMISCHARSGKTVAVVGGGPVGVKLACALLGVGSKPVMIVSSPHILSQVSDGEVAAIVQQHMRNSGIRIMTKTDVVGIEVKYPSTQMLQLSSGKTFACDMTVFCKGVLPNVELLEPFVEIKRGIKVDCFMRTAVSDIYAAGDVAETFDLLRLDYNVAATWPHAVRQGNVAGLNMCGLSVAYEGSLSRNAMEILGLPFVSIGIPRAPAHEDWDLKCKRDGEHYRKLIYRSGRLVGALLVGNVGEAGILQAEMRRRAIEDNREIITRQGGVV